MMILTARRGAQRTHGPAHALLLPHTRTSPLTPPQLSTTLSSSTHPQCTEDTNLHPRTTSDVSCMMECLSLVSMPSCFGPSPLHGLASQRFLACLQGRVLKKLESSKRRRHTTTTPSIHLHHTTTFSITSAVYI